MIYIEYNTDTNNKLDDVTIMGKEKIKRNKIYNSYVGSNRTNGRREGIIKALEFRDVLLEFWEISIGAFW